MTKTPCHILIVDDAAEIRASLSLYLRRQGFTVSVAGSVSEARSLGLRENIRLMLLDVMMPDEDGISFCRELSAQRAVPVILLTALNSDANIIRGLDSGADDYITKPFNPRELLARIQAVLRRSLPETVAMPLPPAALPVVRRFADFVHQPAERSLTAGGDGHVQLLTSGENRLLEALLERPGVTLSRDEIAVIVRGPHAKASPRAADNCIWRLRRKLGDDARAPRLLVTEWGGGYRLNARVSAL